MHAMKEELVKTALLALHTARPGYVTKLGPPVCNNAGGPGSETPPTADSPSSQKAQDPIPHHSEYDEEEWASLNSPFCLIR